MHVRISLTDRPVRATSPVISPSRGPGPMSAPMYNAVANPFITIPATRMTAERTRPSTSGINASDKSTAIAITIMLLTVPNPGF